MNADQTVIEIGTGATEIVGSDRYPYTVVEVRDDQHITIQQDSYTMTAGGYFSEDQTYSYAPNPHGKLIKLSKRKSGRWIEVGQPDDPRCCYAVGYRRAYRDPSF